MLTDEVEISLIRGHAWPRKPFGFNHVSDGDWAKICCVSFKPPPTFPDRVVGEVVGINQRCIAGIRGGELNAARERGRKKQLFSVTPP